MPKSAGKRHVKRVAAILPVRLWGMDTNGRPFIEAVKTSDVSRNGVRLTNVPAKLTVGDVIGLTYKEKKYKFRVAWTSDPHFLGTGSIGLQSLTNNDWIWDLKLPADDVDIYTRPPEQERRLLERQECFLSVEVRGDNSDFHALAFIKDLSVGGCYIGMTTPLSPETRVSIALWLNEQTKIWINGVVISSHAGSGMGLKFTGMTGYSLEAVGAYVKLLAEPQTIAHHLIAD